VGRDEGQVLTPDRIAEYNHQHEALYEAIRSRDVEAAVGSSPAICISRGASWSARRRAAANEMCARRADALCGAVRYEVRGPLRPVVACHCTQCRRMTGHFLAATAAREADLRDHSRHHAQVVLRLGGRTAGLLRRLRLDNCSGMGPGATISRSRPAASTAPPV